ncbi:MAG TPA: hemolysin family protein [Thermomicrobiales bacterium]|nr:hemolysin family protein [Thermomicrobiales bacterium]
MNEIILLLVGILLTIGTGLFVASEFSLVNLDRGELEDREKRGEKGLGLTIRALKITSTHLSSAQLGITLTTLLAGYTFEPAISSLLNAPLSAVGLPEAAVRGVGAIIAIVVATLFSMIFGELVPKNFALAVPLATARAVVPFQTLFTNVFKPLILLFNNTANAVIRSFGIEPKEELSGARSAEELSSLVRRSALAGMLDQQQAQLINRTLRFSERVAEDVMTPRVRTTVVDAEDSAARIIQVADETGFSRFPVSGKSVDDIVGVVHVKQAFAVPADRWDDVTAGDLMTEALRIPESVGVDALLGQLREDGLQIAVVVDEYGGTAGIVTLEDLVEELVGELEDEHDRVRPGVVRHGRSIVFDAAWRPDELYDRTGVRVPEDEDYETVGGFLAEQLDRIPEMGDEVSLEGGTLRVERMVGQRLERIRFIPAEPVEGEPSTNPVSRHDRLVERIEEQVTSHG